MTKTEGDKCACGGTFVFKAPENCSCHIAPPCGHCVESSLVCDECGDHPEDQDD